MTNSDYASKLRAAAVEAIDAIKALDDPDYPLADYPLTVGQARSLPAMRDYLTLAEPERMIELLDEHAAQMDALGAMARDMKAERDACVANLLVAETDLNTAKCIIRDSDARSEHEFDSMFEMNKAMATERDALLTRLDAATKVVEAARALATACIGNVTWSAVDWPACEDAYDALVAALEAQK